MPKTQKPGQYMQVLEGLSQAVDNLDAPTPETRMPGTTPSPWLSEHVTAQEARRDIDDPNPVIRRYAQTVIGLHEEGDRRAVMAGRVEHEGWRLSDPIYGRKG